MVHDQWDSNPSSSLSKLAILNAFKDDINGHNLSQILDKRALSSQVQ
jgi:hypothetical protein